MNRLMALLITFTLFASAGCQRKDLLDPHDHYNLIINATVIFAYIATKLQFCKNKINLQKFARIANFATIVRYKIDLYNAMQTANICTNYCCKVAKFLQN